MRMPWVSRARYDEAMAVGETRLSELRSSLEARIGDLKAENARLTTENRMLTDSVLRNAKQAPVYAPPKPAAEHNKVPPRRSVVQVARRLENQSRQKAAEAIVMAARAGVEQ